MSHGGLGTCKVVSHVEKGCDACPYRNRVDTHLSESRDAPWSDQSWAGVRPGWRSGYPLIQVQTYPLVRPVVHKLVDQIEEWTSTHHNAEMPSDLTSGVKPIGTCLMLRPSRDAT